MVVMGLAGRATAVALIPWEGGRAPGTANLKAEVERKVRRTEDLQGAKRHLLHTQGPRA